MISSWILVIFISAGYGYGAGLDHIHFATKQKCEAAKKAIVENDRRMYHIVAVCVER